MKFIFLLFAESVKKKLSENKTTFHVLKTRNNSIGKVLTWKIEYTEQYNSIHKICEEELWQIRKLTMHFKSSKFDALCNELYLISCIVYDILNKIAQYTDISSMGLLHWHNPALYKGIAILTYH